MFKARKKRVFTISIMILLMLCLSVFAKTGSQLIEIYYQDIKLNVNGVRVDTSNNEPFIYNGTTYLPVRAVAEALGQNVDWDGNTKTVSIGTMPNGKAYLLDVCPPYTTSFMNSCTGENGKSFKMAGKRYSNGLEAYTNEASATFNLNGKYSNLDCIIGHLDAYSSQEYDKTVSFVVDGKTIKTLVLEAECLPKEVSIPLNYGLQLKISTNTNSWVADFVGIAEMTVE